MKNSIHRLMTGYRQRGFGAESGAAAVEFALLLPLMLIIIFAIIDFGMLFDARFVIANLAREGGSLGSRDLKSAADLITLLQTGASPLDLQTSGKVYIWKIRAGTTKAAPNPSIDLTASASEGTLSVNSSISAGSPTLGLSTAIYNRLVFNTKNSTADISEVTVVEIFYKYIPITPLSRFIPGLLTPSAGGIVISSKAIF
jgi:Flp pilus assembly protein TadG